MSLGFFWISLLSVVMSPLFISDFVNLDILSPFNLGKGLSILLIFSKNQLFISLILLLSVSILLILTLSLIISRHLFLLGVLASFRCAVKLLV